MAASILHKTHRENRFATVNITASEDPKLTLAAKGVHQYAMSRPEGWQFYVEDLIKRCKDGKQAVYSAMKCLEENGYLKRERVYNHDKKRVDAWIYHWYEVPEIQSDQLPTSKEVGSKELGSKEVASNEIGGNEVGKQDDYNKPPAVSTMNNDQGSIPKPEEFDASTVKKPSDCGCSWIKGKLLSGRPDHLAIRMHDVWRETFPNGGCIKRPYDSYLTDILRNAKSIDMAIACWRQYLEDSTQTALAKGNVNARYFAERLPSMLAALDIVELDEKPTTKPQPTFRQRQEWLARELFDKYRSEGDTSKHMGDCMDEAEEVLKREQTNG